MATNKQLVDLGVARISYGIYPYCQMMPAIKNAGMAALFQSDI